MRGTKAKRLRQLVYGQHVTSRKGRSYRMKLNGQVIADPLRRLYQRLKRGKISEYRAEKIGREIREPA